MLNKDFFKRYSTWVNIAVAVMTGVNQHIHLLNLGESGTKVIFAINIVLVVAQLIKQGKQYEMDS